MITAVIVTFNSAQHIASCVASLLSACNFCEEQVHIKIVDNGSTDGTRQLVKQLAENSSRIDIILGDNVGFGSGVNSALTNATGDFFVILNPDVKVGSDFFTKIRAVFDTEDRVGIVAPKLYNVDGTVQDSCRRIPSVFGLLANRVSVLSTIPTFKRHLEQYLMQDFNHNYRKTVDVVLGACLIIRSDVFRKLRGFDESYFLYFEDVQLCLDCWVAGWKVVYEPNIVVDHVHMRESTRVFSKALVYHIRSALKFYRSNSRFLFRLPAQMDLSSLSGVETRVSHG